MKFLVVLFLLLFWSKASGEETHFHNCSDTHREELNLTISYAKEMIDTALVSYDYDLFQRWFGDTPMSTVKSDIALLNVPFDNLTFDCGCSGGATAYSFVVAQNPYTVYICNRFWRAGYIGYNSKAGSVLHEFTHFEALLGTHDIATEYQPMIYMASIKPELSLKNAMSFEYFFEELFRRKLR